MGLDRFELSTPRLSSVCSNQLSYRPDSFYPALYTFEFQGTTQGRSLKPEQQARSSAFAGGIAKWDVDLVI